MIYDYCYCLFIFLWHAQTKHCSKRVLWTIAISCPCFLYLEKETKKFNYE
jgi:hypothetical protein